MRQSAAGVYAMTVTESGEVLAGGYDMPITVHDPESLRKVRTIGRAFGVCRGLAQLLGTDRVVCGYQSVPIYLEQLSAATVAPLVQYVGHPGGTSSVMALSPFQFASSSLDCTLKLWDASRTTEVARLEGHEDFTYGMARTDPHTIASASSDQTVAVWDLRTSSRVLTKRVHKAAHGLVSLDAHTLAVGLGNGAVKVLDLRALGRTVWSVRGHTSYVPGLAPLPRGHLASCSGDGTMRVWDVSAKRRVIAGVGGGGQLYACCATADGRLVAACRNGWIYVYGVAWSTRFDATAAWEAAHATV